MTNWCFTTWDLPKLKKMELVHFMCYQKEVCPLTKKTHYQGYVEFKKEYKLFQVKSLFKEKGMYLDRATESREKNLSYCHKDRTYAGSRFLYNDGEVFTEQNNSDWNDFDNMFDLQQKYP